MSVGQVVRPELRSNSLLDIATALRGESAQHVSLDRLEAGANAIGRKPVKTVEAAYEGADKLAIGALHASLHKHANLRAALGSLEEIATHIKADTGWQLDLSRVGLEVVSRDEFMQRAIKDVQARLAMSDAEFAQANSEGGVWARLVGKVTSDATKGAVLGVFLPSESKVLVVEENALKASADGLREILFHELIHAGQHQEHADFFSGINQELRRALELKRQHGGDSAQYQDAMDTVNARMAWIEGQATYLQKAGKEKRFPDSHMNPGLSGILGGMAPLLTHDGRMKVGQYVKGAAAFAKIYQADRSLVAKMFRAPELVDLLLKTRGEVRVQLATGATPEQAAVAINWFTKLNPASGGLKVVTETA